MVEQQVLYERSIAHQNAIEEALQIAKLHPNAKGFLIIDLDDVVFDTRPNIHSVLSTLLVQHNPEATPPTFALTRTGLRRAFGHLFDQNDSNIFTNVLRRLFSDPDMYTDAPLTYEGLPNILQEVTEAGFIPILCLSARGESVMEQSREELRKNNLPDIPVYSMYPEEGSTTDMKMDVIIEISKQLPSQKIFMIDDQQALIKSLNALHNPHITGLLFDTQNPGHTWKNITRILHTLTYWYDILASRNTA